MRKTLLTALLMVCMSLTVFAAKEDLYVLHADFEEGSALPEGWTSESLFGDQAWLVEQDALSYPNGAASGKGRVALRNVTQQTQGFVTRLVSPVMDLTELTAQPMLIFSHAQMQRSGDVDVLRVYYRTSPEGRWVQMAEYTEKITKWQADTLYLDAYSTKTYQIAFEGTDRFGRGIVLDDIIVRPDIVCEDARDIRARSISGNEAVIEWGGSLDTDSFEVVVSTKFYSSIEEVDWSDEAIIQHVFLYDFVDSLKNLDINTSYYIYIKAYCPTLEGQWVGGLIKTLNRVQIPFVEHFDAPYNKDNPSQAPNWTYGTSMYQDDGVTMKAIPYLTNYRTESMWKNYSPNATPALEFAAAINAKALPAGEFAYAASPEIDIERIQDAYVDFWGTSYLYDPKYSESEHYASGIIVGVMDNPADYSTFVPVDTCYAVNKYKFDFFRVKFDKYTGNGKFIAFAADFDEQLLFFVDEVTVGSIKELARPVDIKVRDFTPTSAVVEPTLVGASAWNLIVSDVKTEEPDKLKPANILLSLENIPVSKKDTFIEIANMQGKWVRFYVQAVQGDKKSEWSYAQKYMMPNSLASTALPKTWDFESKGAYSYTEIWDYTSQSASTLGYLADGIISHVFHYADGYINGSTETSAHGGSYSYHLNKRNSYSPYAVFPQMDSLQNKMFTFFYKDVMGSGYSQPYYQIGVMSDPHDTTTFELIKEYNDAQDGTWKKGEVIFLNYTGDARYIAIRLVDGPNTIKGKTASGNIDDVTISAFDGCIKPLNVEAVAEDSAITIKWDANGMTKWAVAVSENWENQELYIRDTVNTNQITVKNLKPHTVYTYQITTLVDAKKAPSDIFTVKTLCAPYELIPYSEGFEDAPTNTSLPEVPNCWTIPQIKYSSSSSSGGSSTYYYPHAYSSSSSAHSGNIYLQLGYSSIKDSMYAALPRLEKDLRLLQMSFFIRGNSSYVNDTLYVGVMSDPNDFATFDTVYTFTVTGMDYKEHIVNLSSYAGQGNYLAFYKPYTNHYYMIDDVEVKELPECEKVFDIKVKGIHDRGAIFSWYKKDATKWQFIVATKNNLTAEQLAAPDASIVMDSLIEVNPFALDDDAIEANKQYYAYVRAVCDGDVYGDWSAPISFKTVCTARGIDDFGGTSKVEDFSQSSTSDCWKFGHRVSGGTHNIISGHIQLINSAAQDGSYAIARKLSIDSLQYLQITFEAWNNGAASSYAMSEVTVGIVTNPEDLSTFVPLQVVEGQREQDAEDHQSYTVRFNDYVGDYNDEYGQFVMFISESGENSNKIELDNIYFDSISAYLEPLDIWADSIGADAMKLRWENTKADSYEYIFSDKLSTLDAATPVALAADSALVTGLGMLKTYYVRVRAKYGENYSRWSNWRKFTTECPASRPIPWAENFDTGSSSTSYKNTPQCWGAFGSDGTVGSDCFTPTVYNSAKKDGVGGLYIGGSKTVASYTILPRFDADLSKAILAFEYKLHTYSSYEDSLWIGVAGNVEDLDALLNSVVWVDQLVEKRTTSAANVWTKYQKKLEGAGNGQYIVLKAKSTYTTYSTSTKYGFYIDNMSVEPEASCNKPEAPVAVARELNGLGFSWTDTIASAWDVIAVGKGDDAPAMDATPAATVDTTYALITGLTPKTEYDLYVRANCGGGDVSYWVGPVTMKTLSMAAYPFFTDFEAEPTELTPGNSTSYKIHEGWVSGLGKGTGASYYPYAKQDPTAATAKYANSYRHDENHSRALYFQANGTNDSAYIVLPVLYDNAANAVVDLDTVQIRFQARKMSSGVNAVDKKIPNFLPTGAIVTGDPSARHQKVTNTRVINVGTISNPSDIKTFELIDAFELAPVLSVKDTFSTDDDPRGNDWWEEISVPLAGAKGKYIAIMYSASSSNDFYVDNIYVEKASGLYAPNAIKGVASTKNSITITWTNRFNAPKVDVGYVAAGGALSELTIITTDKDTLEITGLESNKQYDFYVRANDGAGKTSNWSAGTILATRYVVDLAEASWDFSRVDNYVSQTTGNLLPLGWTVGSKYATSTSYIPKLQFNAVNTTTLAVTTAHGRQKVARNGALYIQSFVSSTNNSDGAYAIMPQINGNLENKELHFWARVCAMTISNGAATSATSATYATAAYPRAIKVGYVTDPDSIQTFVELADIQLPALSSSSAKASEDASGNEFWNEISVPLKGIGEGKYIAFLSEYGNSNNVWIDQIDFRDAGLVCHTPNRLTIDSLGAHAAKFSWQLGEGKWAVLLSTTKNEDQVIRDTVTERAFSDATLLANTSYIFKVKKVCSETEESDEVSIEFTTDCDPFNKDQASWDFTSKLVDMKVGTTTNRVPECWTIGLGTGTSASYYPQASPNTGTVIVAKEETKATSDRALQFYTTTSNYDAYAVLPPLDIDYDKTILHFFGRAARFNKSFNATNKTFLNAINNGYLRKLVVGTMSDPNDLETFVAVDTISYDHEWAVLKESNLTQDSLDANNEYWQEYILDLKNYTGAAYIAFLAPKPEANSYFYIEDLAVMDAETCTEISSLTVSDITKNSAVLNWSIPQGVENFYLEVSTDPDFENEARVVFADTIQALSQNITNLEPATEYFARIKHICSAQKQSEFYARSFTTLYAIRFNEQFTEDRTIPVNWALYNYVDMKPTNTNSWERRSGADDNNMYGPYMSSYLMGSWKRWMATPQIDLSEVAAEDSIALSFDMAITNPAQANLDSVFFMVLISTDGGLTYPEENRTVWGTTPEGCDYPFSAISNKKKGTRWSIDLSKFNGQVIRIMFGTDVTNLQGVNGYLYLDNVQLNYYTKDEYADAVCQWTEYEDANFAIDANDLVVNATTRYEKYSQAEKDGEKDILARLDLTVTGSAETQFEASVCEGGSYMENGFEIEEVRSGIYRRKMAGSNTCDSIATLNLTVLSKQYENVEVTICQGTYYEFNGVKYYTNTIHRDTMTAANGCDSIVTLYLTVNPILEGETEEVFLCPNTSYYFSEKYPELTEAGQYVDTIRTLAGCDSVISVDIKNVPSAETYIRAAICPGEVYNDDVFAGLSKAGDYPSSQKTIYGCDSIVTLHLLVAAPSDNESYVIYDAIELEQLPYVLNGEELLPAGTAKGVYKKDIALNCGTASVIISVGVPQGVDNVFVNTIALDKNPASVGQAVKVFGRFHNAEVEVVSATGALVYKAQNLNAVVIPGMPTAGVYLIRVSQDNDVYQAKLLVK